MHLPSTFFLILLGGGSGRGLLFCGRGIWREKKQLGSGWGKGKRGVEGRRGVGKKGGCMSPMGEGFHF